MTRLFRAFAFLALGLLLGGTASYSFAGYAQLKPPANLGGSVGSRVTAGAVAANAGQFSAGFTTQVAGKTVTMPATMRFASNAAQVALGAVRLSPAALVGSAVAAWLLTEGIQYIDGQFKKTTAGVSPGEYGGGFNYQCSGAPIGPISHAMAIQCAASSGWGVVTSVIVSPMSADPLGAYQATAIYAETGNRHLVAVFSPQNTCPAGTSSNGTQCVGQATTEPAVEEDYDPLEAEPLPDDVAEELAPKAVPIPLDDPVFNPQPVKVPLSDPYPKPNGQPGETVKDVVKVTPAPDEKVKIETEVEPVTGPNGVPIPTTNPDGSANPDAAPEEKPDFCIENPDALACWKDGEPEDVDLAKDTKNVAITPQGGWGPDTSTCPQPRKHVLKNGYTVQMSWEPVCDAAGMFRPVVLGLAWLAAIYAFMAMYRKSQA